MMNPQDFINKHNNQYLGNKQCVAVFEQYCLDSGWGFEPDDYAMNLLKKADPNHWQIIINNPNDPNQLPIEGDQFIFGAQPWNNYMGHEGMIISAGLSSFIGFEQNNPLGSPTHAVTHSTKNPYAGMIGWLRPKLQKPTIVAASAPVERWATTLRDCNERVAPHLNAGVTYVLGPGTRFQVMEMVAGDSVNGNNQWAHTPKGWYVHSSNLAITG